MSEKTEKKDVSEGIKKITEMFNEYKETFLSAFKDMDVEVKEWNFSVSKVENQHNVEASFKVTIKPKKPKQSKPEA